MRTRSRLTLKITLVLLAGLWVLTAASAGCSTETVANDATSQSAEPSPSVPRPSAASAETPTQAARRIFPEARQLVVTDTESPQVLKGAAVGEPWAVARDYAAPGPTIAAWVLRDDANAVTSGMFAAMMATPQRDDYFLVPMVKDGRSVCEFEMSRNAKERWEWVSGITDPLPGGSICDAEAATVQLCEELGANAEVRFCVFLPSGLIFAVGSDGEQEAAVYLTFNNAGPGITSFDKYLPRTGRLFTPDELAELLTP